MTGILAAEKAATKGYRVMVAQHLEEAEREDHGGGYQLYVHNDLIASFHNWASLAAAVSHLPTAAYYHRWRAMNEQEHREIMALVGKDSAENDGEEGDDEAQHNYHLPWERG